MAASKEQDAEHHGRAWDRPIAPTTAALLVVPSRYAGAAIRRRPM